MAQDIFSVRMDSGQLAELRARADERGVPASELVREAIGYWLDAQLRMGAWSIDDSVRSWVQLPSTPEGKRSRPDYKRDLAERRSALREEAKRMQIRLEKLEAQIRPYADLAPQLRRRVSDLESQLAQLRDELATARHESERTEALVRRLHAEREAVAGNLERLQIVLDDLATGTRRLKKGGDPVTRDE